MYTFFIYSQFNKKTKYLNPYNIALVAALILQQKQGTMPTMGDSLDALKNIIQQCIIAYGVQAKSQTIWRNDTILVSFSSIWN